MLPSPRLRSSFGATCGRCRSRRLHEQHIAATVVARYVRLSLAKPEHATVGQLERELGLTPAAMLRMRLVVETPEEQPAQLPAPYAHLRSEFEAA